MYAVSANQRMEVSRRNKELLIASHLVLKQKYRSIVKCGVPSVLLRVYFFFSLSKLAYMYFFDNTSDFEQLTEALLARTLAEYQRRCIRPE